MADLETFLSPHAKHSSAATTIFSVMSGLANTHDAINLSQGFPDFPIDRVLADLLHEAALNGYNQYAPMAGLPHLREAIAADWFERRGIEINPSTEITITPGATYGIYTAFLTLLKPGDEAILLEPAYDSYKPNIEMCGAIPVPVPMEAPHFRPDWDRIKKAITSRTRAIIINTPHNPTGTIWSAQDWDQLAELIRDTNIVILSDEVYEQLVYDGGKHYSVLQHEELRAKSFALFSFGKVHHTTGWKMGYCIAPSSLTDAFRKLHQFISFSVNTPAQYALSQYLNHKVSPPNILLQERRDLFISLMKETGFLLHEPAAGSYFQLASYSNLSTLPDLAFAEWLTKEHKVAAIPVSAFYTNGQDQKMLRFCFAKKEETLRDAVEKLKSIPTLAK